MEESTLLKNETIDGITNVFGIRARLAEFLNNHPKFVIYLCTDQISKEEAVEHAPPDWSVFGVDEILSKNADLPETGIIYLSAKDYGVIEISNANVVTVVGRRREDSYAFRPLTQLINSPYAFSQDSIGKLRELVRIYRKVPSHMWFTISDKDVETFALDAIYQLMVSKLNDARSEESDYTLEDYREFLDTDLQELTGKLQIFLDTVEGD